MSGLNIAQRAVAVTPADGVELAGGLCEGLWIGVAGTLAVRSYDSSQPGGKGAVVNTSVNPGLFPVKCWGVEATGTAATGILALY